MYNLISSPSIHVGILVISICFTPFLCQDLFFNRESWFGRKKNRGSWLGGINHLCVIFQSSSKESDDRGTIIQSWLTWEPTRLGFTSHFLVKMVCGAKKKKRKSTPDQTFLPIPRFMLWRCPGNLPPTLAWLGSSSSLLATKPNKKIAPFLQRTRGFRPDF